MQSAQGILRLYMLHSSRSLVTVFVVPICPLECSLDSHPHNTAVPKFEILFGYSRGKRFNRCPKHPKIISSKVSEFENSLPASTDSFDALVPWPSVCFLQQFPGCFLRLGVCEWEWRVLVYSNLLAAPVLKRHSDHRFFGLGRNSSSHTIILHP